MKKSKIINGHTPKHTLRMLEGLNHNDNAGREMLNELSMLPINPICSKFPMAMVHRTVDVYRVPLDEPMQDFPYGLLPLIRECTANIVKDETRFTSNVKTWLG